MFVALLLISLVACTSASHLDQNYCQNQETYYTIYQVPNHNCACNAKTAGALRYHDGKLQVCNGNAYENVCGSSKAPLGTVENPARSCRHILDDNSSAKSGMYTLKLGKAIVKAYCFMGSICNSRGWTMIMKIDGNKNTFHYNAAYWTNKQTYNVAGAAGGLDRTETKLDTYSHFALSKLCLGMNTEGRTNWLSLNYRAESLYSLIADNSYRETHIGRTYWKALIDGSSLQRNCNREGFNSRQGNGAMARIGIIGNQENDCNSPDSRIGFGTGGNNCGQNDKNSAGNEARCSPDNGDKSIKSFGYIFAQEHLAGAPAGSFDNPAQSCKAIKAARADARNGAYYLNLPGKVTKVYCHMDVICGSSGWTMIMKIDGNKNTFHYNAAYWTNKETYNVAGAAGGLDRTETKLDTYSHFALSKLCLGMNTEGRTNWLSLNYRAESLYSLIADNSYRETHIGRTYWKALIDGSSLQRNCNREGFNSRQGNGAMARIGIIGNQENDCNSPDSRIGFGTGGNNCGQNDKNSAGNEARCSPDNGDKSIKSFGYIFAQEHLAGAPAGSFDNPAQSCKAIKAARADARNGAYYLNLPGKVTKVYCHMDVICGSSGWTILMKIDGTKRTFHYDAVYWTTHDVYNVEAASEGLNHEEMKLSTYSSLPFSKLCLGMKIGRSTRWLSLPMCKKVDSLYSIIASNRYTATRLGRNAWKTLVPGASLQRHCNREGFNSMPAGKTPQHTKARIGIVSNQENNCGSPDSRIGFGTGGTACGQKDYSAGNEARCGGDAGNKSVAGFGFILAQ